MGIVLSVLALLGQILLWLLGILAVLLLLLLFYPIRYRVRGVFQDSVAVEGNFHWLWFVLRVPFSYRDGAQWRIRLFGVDLLKVMERRGRRRGSREGKKRRQMSLQACEADDSGDAPEKADTRQGDLPKEDAVQERPRGAKKKLRRLPAVLRDLLRKLRRAAGQGRKIISLLREDNSRALVCIFRDNVVHLWRKLKPRILRADLLFGTGDPASTGEALGVFAVLYAWYGGKIHITPDFENKVCRGEILLVGRLSVFTLGLVLARVFFSREWGQFKKRYDQIRT